MQLDLLMAYRGAVCRHESFRAALQDQVGIVTDEAGQPAQSALTFPSTPAALAASEIYVLAACADGVHVYDRTTAAWVQSLPYPDGLRTAPGQQLYTAHNPSGSVVLVAGYRRVSPQLPQ